MMDDTTIRRFPLARLADLKAGRVFCDWCNDPADAQSQDGSALACIVHLAYLTENVPILIVPSVLLTLNRQFVSRKD